MRRGFQASGASAPVLFARSAFIIREVVRHVDDLAFHARGIGAFLQDHETLASVLLPCRELRGFLTKMSEHPLLRMRQATSTVRAVAMKCLLLLPFLLVFASCVHTGTPGGHAGMPQIINVSAYDPKEKQRSGVGYSEHDVSALRANGASGLIARAGKGGNLDEKCANFLMSADRVGMLPGVYYRLQTHVDAVVQADQFVSRAQALASRRSWNAPALLLCGDFDAKSRLSDILRFMDRVESRTGVVPVAYLENSAHLKQLLSSADSESKAKLRRMPYWLALYSHTKGAGNPGVLLNQYDVWSKWTLWQYGGVEWQGGRSRPKVYNNGAYRFPPYFGSMDRPLERNVFDGSLAELQAFWKRHGLRLQ